MWWFTLASEIILRKGRQEDHEFRRLSQLNLSNDRCHNISFQIALQSHSKKNSMLLEKTEVGVNQWKRGPRNKHIPLEPLELVGKRVSKPLENK